MSIDEQLKKCQDHILSSTESSFVDLIFEVKAKKDLIRSGVEPTYNDLISLQECHQDLRRYIKRMLDKIL